MKTARTSTKKMWQNIGSNAAGEGIPLERVACTKSEAINKLIREAYEARQARDAKRDGGAK